VFVWRYLVRAVVTGESPVRFATRGEAEAWLGESWGDLAESGIDEVELIDERTGAVAYRMSLAAG
jgi:hypothetical protein